MKRKIYSAYGSNMNIEQMNMRCPNAKLIGVGTIKNYRLTFRGKSRGVANIEKQVESIVPVVLWEITAKCEKALDIYEGYPRLYDKRNVEVINEKGEIVEAFVYIMVKEYENMPAQPTSYYLGIIWDGYLDNNIPLIILREALAGNLNEIDKNHNSIFGKIGN
jgi:hypothetical protein